jgi:hypothetical protein
MAGGGASKEHVYMPHPLFLVLMQLAASFAAGGSAVVERLATGGHTKEMVRILTPFQYIAAAVRDWNFVN